MSDHAQTMNDYLWYIKYCKHSWKKLSVLITIFWVYIYLVQIFSVSSSSTIKGYNAQYIYFVQIFSVPGSLTINGYNAQSMFSNLKGIHTNAIYADYFYE